MPRILNTKEAAVWLGCSETSIIRLRQKGKLPFFKVGDLIKFREEDLTAFVERQVEESRNGFRRRLCEST